MGKLFELCQVPMDHEPLTNFGKKYYILDGSLYKYPIIFCEDCKDKLIIEYANNAAYAIDKAIKTLRHFDRIGVANLLPLNDGFSEDMSTTLKIMPPKILAECNCPYGNAFGKTFDMEAYVEVYQSQFGLQNPAPDIDPTLPIAMVSFSYDALGQHFEGPRFDIYNDYEYETLATTIGELLLASADFLVKEIPEDEVQKLMDQAASPEFHSECVRAAVEDLPPIGGFH